MPTATTRARGASSTRHGMEVVEVRDDGARRTRRRDHLATEEPLEIRLVTADGSQPVSVTMRTPGGDFELAAGFLFAEGILQRKEDVVSIRYCVDAAADGPQRYNVVNVHLAPHVRVPREGVRRSFHSTSSCGVCGKTSLEAVQRLACPRVGSGLTIAAATLLELPDRLHDAQPLFRRTGGLHAAAVFSPNGRLVRVREDVGRHNALDKAVGAALLLGEVPMGEAIVLMSGRLSFELVQKVARAGVPVLAGVSAPSSLAVEMAAAAGITLVGFLRDRRFNVYTAGERIS